TTSESLSIPEKRPGESQIYNRKPVAPLEEEFWNELSEAQVVLKLPDNIDTTMFMSGPLSEYMSVKGNEIILITTPKSGRWHEYVKGRVGKYYAPIWTEEEIWDVWNEIFDEYDDEPNVDDVISQCDAYAYLKNDGGDNYSGKAIHIIPNFDFTDKTYVPALTEIWEALYRHYEKHTKDTIINIIRNFAGGAGGTLAGKFFEIVAHDILRRGGDFTVRRLTKDGIKQPEEELHLQNLTHKQFRDIDEITPGCYNIPKGTNFESVDAIAPQCNGIHHLYQMTTAETHHTKVNGLSKLENHLKGLPIHLYFVVPNINNMFNDFRLQKYVTSGNIDI
ncbi:12692_t:CDS:2, partial [Acaulospora colombiana]